MTPATPELSYFRGPRIGGNDREVGEEEKEEAVEDEDDYDDVGKVPFQHSECFDDVWQFRLTKEAPLSSPLTLSKKKKKKSDWQVTGAARLEQGFGGEVGSPLTCSGDFL